MCRSIITLLISLGSLAVAVAAPVENGEQELLQFQGNWKAVSLQFPSGKQPSDEDIQKTHLVIDGNKFSLSSKEWKISGTFAIDPTKCPKTIDAILVADDGRETSFLGIYQMQGDVRKSCFSLPGKERPREFTSGQGYIGFEWKREQASP